MFKVMIKFRNSENMLILWFEDGHKAKSAAINLMAPNDGIRVIGDEFGAEVNVKREEISGVLVVDLERAARAGGQEALINAREQARVNAQAQRDPAMNLARTPAAGGLIG